MRRATLDPAQIEPPHAVEDWDKLAGLVGAMRRDGWQGRPLLVIVSGDGYQALTGSHRVAAARQCDLAIPALVIEDDDLTPEQWEDSDPRAAIDDDHRRQLLADLGLTDALALMQQEP